MPCHSFQHNVMICYNAHICMSMSPPAKSCLSETHVGSLGCSWNVSPFPCPTFVWWLLFCRLKMGVGGGDLQFACFKKRRTSKSPFSKTAGTCWVPTLADGVANRWGQRGLNLCDWQPMGFGLLSCCLEGGLRHVLGITKGKVAKTGSCFRKGAPDSVFHNTLYTTIIMQYDTLHIAIPCAPWLHGRESGSAKWQRVCCRSLAWIARRRSSGRTGPLDWTRLQAALVAFVELLKNLSIFYPARLVKTQQSSIQS